MPTGNASTNITGAGTNLYRICSLIEYVVMIPEKGKALNPEISMGSKDRRISNFPRTRSPWSMKINFTISRPGTVAALGLSGWVRILPAVSE